MQARDTRILTAAMAVSFVYGSIHAYSVLNESIESSLNASRGSVSLAYSIALASLTVAVLLGHRLYRMVRVDLLIVLAGGLGAAGLALAASVDSRPALWIGYGVMFGFANGIGYGVALNLANEHLSDHCSPTLRTTAMASITAVYAVGAGGSAFVLDALVGAGGPRLAFLVLAGVIVTTSLAAAFGLQPALRHEAGLRDEAGTWDEAGPVSSRAPDTRIIATAWLTYGTAVAAGLMAMGHAASIVTDKGGSSADGATAAFVIAALSAAAGFAAGWFANHYRPADLLTGLAALSAVGLVALTIVDKVSLTLAAFAAIGIGYGATISLFPVITSQIFGAAGYVIAYGRIFTSWGLAGLLAPTFAGVLFTQTGSYTTPLLIASLLAIIAAGMARRLGAVSPTP